MRTIIKRPEPHSLALYRHTAGATFDDYPDKPTLRTALVAEQRGLCCYCLQQIRPQIGSMKIEHWHSRAIGHYPAEQLDYWNLLGACMGNEGQPWERQHCDTRKGDRNFSRNPANAMPRIEDLVRFLGDGRIVSDIPAFDAELNNVLNLNAAHLRNRRKALLDAFKDSLVKRGRLPRATLLKWLQDWNGELSPGELREFCQVVIYWLQKRLARAIFTKASSPSP
jgi:uncharacterized protein (TIGR02646 family)